MGLVKYITALLMLLASFEVCGQDNPALRFEPAEWDFGAIEENGGRVSHDFTIANISSEPVVVLHIATSCGCTTTEYSAKPVMPSCSERFTVFFDPRGFEGEFEKRIYVTTLSGTERYRNTLVIKGTVNQRPKTVEDLYPFYMASGIRFDRADVAFNYIGQGKVESTVVKYINTSDKDVKISFKPQQTSGLLDIFAPETVCAGCSGEITLTYDLEKQSSTYGMRHDTNIFVADGVESQIPLYTAMIGVDDFSNAAPEASPAAVFSSQFHDFGTIKRRSQPYTHTLKLTNEGPMPLRVRAVENKESLRIDLKEGTVIEPKHSIEVKMTLNSGDYLPQEVFESVVIILNDPRRPMREIKCAARITE